MYRTYLCDAQGCVHFRRASRDPKTAGGPILLNPRAGPCQRGIEPLGTALAGPCQRGIEPLGTALAGPASAQQAPVAQLDRAPDYESGGQEFESLRARQFLRYKTEHAKSRRFCTRSGDKRTQQYAFRTHDAKFFRIDLREFPEVITPRSSRAADRAGTTWW